MKMMVMIMMMMLMVQQDIYNGEIKIGNLLNVTFFIRMMNY